VQFRRLSRSIRAARRALATRRLTFVSDQIPYELRDVSARRVVNAVLTEASVQLRPERPWGLPTHVMLEPSTFCNLRCTLCPVTVGLGRPQGHMAPELFRRIVDQVGDTALLGLLWDWGEPFVNPAIYDMIAHAKAKGMSLVSSSNGHLFADERHADRVVECGLDTLIFAIDGLTQETYVRYRGDGDLATALEGVRTVVRRKRERGSRTPTVNLRFIVMRHNEHEIPRLRELAVELGVDALTLKTLNPGSQDPYSAEEKHRHDDMVPRDERWRRFRDDRRRRADNPCAEPWNGTVIHWNGTVCSCTYDTQDRRVLGDLREASFAEVWWGPRYRDLRRRFRADWRSVEMCGHCSFAFEGGSCTEETIAEVALHDSRLRRLAAEA